MKYTKDEEIKIKEHIEKMLKDGKSRIEIAQSLGYKRGENLRRWLRKFDLKSNGHPIKYQAKEGDQFACWTFISKSETNPRYWKCKCKCGNIKEIDLYSLFCKSLRARSRGCNECKNSNMSYNQWAGCGELSGSYWNNLKRCAKMRDLEFNLTIEDGWNLFLKQERKCAYTDNVIIFSKRRGQKQTASLDRIDSSKGYTLDNVQWIHKDIQKIKWDFHEKVFLNYIMQIYKHQKRLGKLE